ncbi:MAG: lysophospholipid acyltransferase family protein [Pseudomonadota bacterium]
MMAYAWRWIRSLLFSIQMYFMMFVMALYYTPRAVLDRNYAFYGVQTYCRWVRWTASWMLGLRSEVRGKVPTDEVIIAAKHQSFFDIIMLVSVLPRPKFIMKAELRFAPILGWYGMRIGCVPVKRGRRSEAMKKMVKDVAEGRAEPGQLIVYPQGTRVAIDAYLPYKVGVSVLRSETGQTVVPAAANVGVFWPRRGIYRRPGLAVMEFLDPIPTQEAGGPDPETFLQELEVRVEKESKRLMADAGFIAPH